MQGLDAERIWSDRYVGDVLLGMTTRMSISAQPANRRGHRDPSLRSMHWSTYSIPRMTFRPIFYGARKIRSNRYSAKDITVCGPQFGNISSTRAFFEKPPRVHSHVPRLLTPRAQDHPYHTTASYLDASALVHHHSLHRYCSCSLGPYTCSPQFRQGNLELGIQA